MIDMEVNKFKIGDKVKLIQGLTKQNTKLDQNVLDELLQQEYLTITNSSPENTYELNDYWWFSDDQLKSIYINNSHETLNQLIDMRIEEYLNKPLDIRVKYFDNAKELEKIVKGNWIDVYANKDMFVSLGERAMIPLGFALELPQGYEGHLAPRSSTFKTWGIIETNSVGVVDDTYIGDNDQWHMPVYCLMSKNFKDKETDHTKGTWIHKGDKIGQFRIMKTMPTINFNKVDSFGNADRGGFGTTGER